MQDLNYLNNLKEVIMMFIFQVCAWFKENTDYY